MSEVTVVIGAGQIGQAIPRRVSAGKHVLLADLHQTNADATAEVLADAGFDVGTAIVDVASRESVHALAETAAARGDVTGVIHAAGVSPNQTDVRLLGRSAAHLRYVRRLRVFRVCRQPRPFELMPTAGTRPA